MTNMTQKSQQHVAANKVLIALNNVGFAAFVAGGAVRDQLLDLTPKDFDVTTSATPEQVVQVFPGNAKFVGAAFGVSLVTIDDFTMEVATFRQESEYTDGRHPDNVHFVTDPEQDVLRRDFTVNALLMDQFGRVLDFVNGQADLASNMLVCVGDADARFTEDPLRMLRAVRFVCEKGFNLAPSTFQAMQRNAHLVTNLSAERVQAELSRVLTSGRASTGLELMSLTGLLDVVLPEVAAFVGVEHNNPKYHPEGDVFNHVQLLLKNLPKNCDLDLALASLLHDVGKPATFAVGKNGKSSFHGHAEVGAKMAEVVLKRLKFENKVVDQVVSHTAQHMKFFDVQKLKRSKLVRFVRQDNFANLLELHRLDCAASNNDFTHYTFVKNFLEEQSAEMLNPVRFVNGNDLVALGFKPSKLFKYVLEYVESEQLEGRVNSKEEGLQAALQYVKELQ